jgi:hypothetical protein
VTLYAEPRADGRVALYADPNRRHMRAMMPRGAVTRRHTAVTVPSLGVVTLRWLEPLPLCIVVPRIERVLTAPTALLALPGRDAAAGHVAVWSVVGEHAECPLAYYRAETRPARSVAEIEAVDLAVAQFRAWMAALPVGERCDVVVRARLPASFR